MPSVAPPSFLGSDARSGPLIRTATVRERTCFHWSSRFLAGAVRIRVGLRQFSITPLVRQTTRCLSNTFRDHLNFSATPLPTIARAEARGSVCPIAAPLSLSDCCAAQFVRLPRRSVCPIAARFSLSDCRAARFDRPPRAFVCLTIPAVPSRDRRRLWTDFCKSSCRSPPPARPRPPPVR